METARCRAFLAAAETGSFTKRLKTGLHAVWGKASQNALESELGRAAAGKKYERGVAPTADGGRCSCRQ